MPYVLVSDFKSGMDRRRQRVAGEPGALWSLKNGHLTRGGEIEGPKQFVQKYQLPAGETFGLYALDDAVYVFGSLASPTIPSGVTYVQLEHPDGLYAMTDVLDVQPFDGKLYVIAEFANGSVYHFYDGVLVTDWYAGRVRSSMSTNSDIATMLGDLIDADGEYTVSVSTNVVTITGPAVNVSFTVGTYTEDGGGTDDQTLVAATTQAATVSLPQISTVTVGGTFQVGDKFSIKLTKSGTVKVFGAEAQPIPVATMALTFKSKMHAAGGTNVNFSAVNDATAWNRDATANAGAGFINASNQDEGAKTVTALEVYQGQLAIFARKSIQIWAIDADPDANAYLQTLRRTGTPARHSVASYGNNDVFYLDGSTGIRSIKARDSSNAAYVSDVGTAIDPFVQDYIATLTADELSGAYAAIEPKDGRYWLAVKDRIFVFSYFPGSKISAWSYYEPGFTVDAMSSDGDKLWLRSGDSIYLYGGDDGTDYPDTDELETVAELMFLSAGKPATKKTWEGFDAAVVNDWSVGILPNPNDETQEIDFGTVSRITYSDMRGKFEIPTTHIAVKMSCARAGVRRISNVAVHYESEHEDG